MQVMNWFKFQAQLPEVDTLKTRQQDALIFAIQALCTAGPRKVASRAEIFKVMFQRTEVRHSRHCFYTLTCSEAGNGRDTVR